MERLDLRNRLVRALQIGEIRPWFQPVVDLVTGRLLGFEALARWCPGDGPMLPPAEWLPFAEESGLVTEVDLAILEAGVAQLASDQLKLDCSFTADLGETPEGDAIPAAIIQLAGHHVVGADPSTTAAVQPVGRRGG